MHDGFHKFPSTPHLLWLGDGTPRGDKVLSTVDRTEFLQNDLIVEEKVDGANVGFSFSGSGNVRIQNRGQYLEDVHSAQFKKIRSWVREREDALFDFLGDHLILFGEWLYAVHSIRYAGLPDLFLAFDVYDRIVGSFWSTLRRDALLDRIGLAVVPRVGQGRFSLAQLEELACGPSAFADGEREGVYLRVEDEQYLKARAKLVNPAFTQQISDHWSKRLLAVNELRSPNHAKTPK